MADLSRRSDVLCRPGRPQAHRRPVVVLRQGDQRSLARTGAAAQASRRGRQDLCVAGAVEGGLMRHPGEQFYPEGVRWDDPLPRGTLPDLLSAASAEFGSRPAIEFRDRPISYSELEALVETAASAFLRAGYGKNSSVALFLGNSPDHPVNFFGALKAGARIVHLSPLDGERALSHKLSDSGARILVVSELAALVPMALKFLEKGLLDRLIVCQDDDWGAVGNPHMPIPDDP